MHALICLVSVLAATPASSSPASSSSAPRWEKVFEAPGGTKGWLSSVLATPAGDWFAGGKWGVTRNGKEEEETPGATILGLSDQGAAGVFAVGSDELVLRFDGKAWLKEHVGPKPKRRGHGAHLLDSMFVDAKPDAPLVAHGPSLVLARRPDATWAPVREADGKKLLLLAELGPASARPPKCTLRAWMWRGRGLAWFACHDGRSFLYSDGAVAPKGTLAKECKASISAVGNGGSDVYVGCAGKLWKTGEEGWRPIEVPKDEREVRAISVAKGCMYLAGRYTVWRNCAL